jgi:hypothetical protein
MSSKADAYLPLIDEPRRKSVSANLAIPIARSPGQFGPPQRSQQIGNSVAAERCIDGCAHILWRKQRDELVRVTAQEHATP